MRDMMSNGFFAGMNPCEMAFGTYGNHATAFRAPVAFYRQGFVKAVKVALDIAVTPDLPVPAAEAMRRPRPRKVASLFINPLEINGDKPYHQSTLDKGLRPQTKKGGEFAITLRPTFFTA
jgi:hypothetical protein